MRGRTRREAARRRKTEWKVIYVVEIPLAAMAAAVVNGSEKNHVAYGLASAYSVRAVRVVSMHAITFSFVEQSSSRGLEKFGENIPPSPEVIGVYTRNFHRRYTNQQQLEVRGRARREAARR